jgi:hypothetical protein
MGQRDALVERDERYRTTPCSMHATLGAHVSWPSAVSRVLHLPSSWQAKIGTAPYPQFPSSALQW